MRQLDVNVYALRWITDLMDESQCVGVELKVLLPCPYLFSRVYLKDWCLGPYCS